MFTSSNLTWPAVVLVGLTLVAPLKASDERATPEQLQELRSSLADAYAQRDNKLIDLSVKGFTAAGQKGTQLDESIHDAQFQAAMQMLQPTQRIQLEVAALYSKARAGNADALKKLVEYAGTKIESKPVDPNTPAAYEQSQRNNVELSRVSQSLDALKALQFPGVAELARVRLSGSLGTVSDMGFGYMSGDSLTRTCVDCLLQNREAGLKELETLVVNPALALKTRINIIRALTNGTWNGLTMQPPPEDVKKRFVEKIPVLIDAMDSTTDAMTAINLYYTVQQLNLGDDAMRKFDEFTANRANETARQNIQMNMQFRKQTLAVKGEKPKLPPKENPEF